VKVILIANPKGGCGKTTLSSNLAGYLARTGHRVILSDLDRQSSSLNWLQRRPEWLPRIHAWEGRGKQAFHFKFVPDWVVLDAPAGVRGDRLQSAMAHANRVLVPVQPSPLDMEASEAFLDKLSEMKRVRKERVRVGLVGNRVSRRTRAAEELHRFCERSGLPVLTYLRETQLYVHLAGSGETLFDLPPYRSKRDREEWGPITEWLADGK